MLLHCLFFAVAFLSFFDWESRLDYCDMSFPLHIHSQPCHEDTAHTGTSEFTFYFQRFHYRSTAFGKSTSEFRRRCN
ncbi:hypothetical protein IWZ03DRAFT_379527 [Phyllosticta citriasiana]|uniref:Secreted protein n=1 Tax=Phyllosticta citriasiana TaxID=595635 RepID=A0ABR1KIB5_9PEZI